MCTAISYRPGDHYFGRNLDLEYGYHETVTITPRNFRFEFCMTGQLSVHYAMIGMATVMNGIPLYYEATNEKGLSIAGLNFPGNAVYLPPMEGKINLAPFEFIPWLLGQCASIRDVRLRMEHLCLADISFSPELPPTPLHWLIADREQSLVVEPMADGLHIFDNPIGVLTNNPPFDFHMHNLGLYLNVMPNQAVSRFSSMFPMAPWSNGMGGLGLPGDFSSASRFVKAAFVKLNSAAEDHERSCVSQFFHILSSVAMPRGAVLVDNGKPEITRYTCCCNTDKGIYYYQTYDNSRIHGVDLHRVDLDGTNILAYPLILHEPINIQN